MDPDVLEDVLGVRAPGAKKPQNQLKEARRVPPVQRAKRRLVSGPDDGVDQLAIVRRKWVGGHLESQS